MASLYLFTGHMMALAAGKVTVGLAGSNGSLAPDL